MELKAQNGGLTLSSPTIHDIVTHHHVVIDSFIFSTELAISSTLIRIGFVLERQSTTMYDHILTESTESGSVYSVR